MNFTVTREKAYQGPIKSKDPMILVSGFRRYVVNPIYSTFTRGGPNNVHKFERFLQEGKTSMATIYAPIQFGPAPIMLFEYKKGAKWNSEQAPALVATGTLLDPQPLRINAKRIILTGHPFKIHKRGAVVRFMFQSPEDIDYFRPVQLHTKFGRSGHIKESLGTHGYMKCQFDQGIKQHDTVCMNLYKRVFPKWTTRLYSSHLEDEVDDELME
jgi:pre-rRNA-processing protein TSR1